jgi:hypothetical protein
MSRYDRRVDRVAAELLEPSVDRNVEALSPELQAKMHQLLALIAGVVVEAERDKRARYPFGPRAKANLRLVEGGRR